MMDNAGQNEPSHQPSNDQTAFEALDLTNKQADISANVGDVLEAVTGRVDMADDLLTHGGDPVRAKEDTRTPSTDHFSAKNKSFESNNAQGAAAVPIPLPMSQKGFADTQKAIMEKRRLNCQERFNSARNKATEKLNFGQQIEMRRRKKRLFTENGQEYYQIESLTKMTPLKTFNLV